MTEMENAVLRAIAKMGMMKFFPSDEFTRDAIAQEIESMASEPHQVLWLADQMVRHWNEWPGPLAMRAAFCQKFPPADGQSVDMQGFDGTWERENEHRSITVHGQAKQLSTGTKSLLLKQGIDPSEKALTRTFCNPESTLPDYKPNPRRERQNERWREICKDRPALVRNLKRLATEFGTTDDLDRRDAILNQLTGAR